MPKLLRTNCILLVEPQQYWGRCLLCYLFNSSNTSSSTPSILHFHLSLSLGRIRTSHELAKRPKCVSPSHLHFQVLGRIPKRHKNSPQFICYTRELTRNKTCQYVVIWNDHSLNLVAPLSHNRCASNWCWWAPFCTAIHNITAHEELT